MLERMPPRKWGANNKWGFFPSASVAWVLTEEEFMEGISWVRNLKIRLGYGLSGNQDAIDSYNSLRLMKPNGVVSVMVRPPLPWVRSVMRIRT